MSTFFIVTRISAEKGTSHNGNLTANVTLVTVLVFHFGLIRYRRQRRNFKITCHLDRSRDFAQRRHRGVERPAFSPSDSRSLDSAKPNVFASLERQPRVVVFELSQYHFVTDLDTIAVWPCTFVAMQTILRSSS